MNIRKLYGKFYKIIGFGLLITLTGILFFYAGLMIFFIFNASWVAPTILSATSDKMLQFQAGYQSQQQTVSTIKVLLDSQQRALETSKYQLKILEEFRREIDNGSKLQTSKSSDIAISRTLATKLDLVKSETEASASKGLITKFDAVQTLASIQSFKNSITDSTISATTLQQQLITLDVQIRTVRDQVGTQQFTVEESLKNLKNATTALDILDSSSYARALATGSNLAFIPYDNIRVATVGAPVYDCSLMVIVCHKVGTIRKIYKDEQIVDFPLFNIHFSHTIRGVLIDMNMTKPESMRSTIFFIGKPLFI